MIQTKLGRRAPDQTQATITLSKALHAVIKQMAEAEGRSVSNLIRTTMEMKAKRKGLIK